MEVNSAISSNVAQRFRDESTLVAEETGSAKENEKFLDQGDESEEPSIAVSRTRVVSEKPISGCPFVLYRAKHLNETAEGEHHANDDFGDESSRQDLLNKLRNIKGENLPKDIEDWSFMDLRGMLLEEQLSNIPEEVRYLVPAALRDGDCGRSALDRPEWLDIQLFCRGQKFAMDNFFGLCFANILSLCLIFSDVDGLVPMIFTGQSSTPYLSFKRYLSTVHRVRSWYKEDPWAEGSVAYKNVRIVRKMHRAVRKRLCESSREEISAAAKIPEPWCTLRKTFLEDMRSSSCAQIKDPFEFMTNVSYRPKGLNQADMTMTQFAFMGLITSYPQAFGVHSSTEQDIEAFCHLWRCIGYLLGIEDEYNFCRGSLSEIRERSKVVIDRIFKPKLCDVHAEWEHMARCVVAGTSYYLEGPSFDLMILYLTDLLEIPTPRLRASLSYTQRFTHLVNKWLFYYIMRIRGVTARLNSIVHKAIDRAAQFSPAKHAALEKRSNKTVLTYSPSALVNQRLIRQADP